MLEDSGRPKGEALIAHSETTELVMRHRAMPRKSLPMGTKEAYGRAASRSFLDTSRVRKARWSKRSEERDCSNV